MSSVLATLRGPVDRSKSRRGSRVVYGLGAAGIAGLLAGGSWWWRAAQPVTVKDHWAAVARGRAYLASGRADLAIQAVHNVRDEAPGAGEAMEIAGLALIRSGEYRLARLALERALKLQPKQFNAATALAELNFALGNGRRGIELLQEAVRLRPREFRIWLTMGKALHDLGDYPKAIQAYERAVALRPDDRQALIGLIGCLLSSDQPDQAGPLVLEGLRRFPDDPMVLGFAAMEALQANRLDEAISRANDALRANPQNLDALQARARVLQSRWEQALPDAEQAVAAWPNELGALQLLVKIQTRLGLKEKAAETQSKRERAQKRIELMNQLGEELTRNPDDPQIPWKIGQTAQEAGSFALASQCYQAAMALDPNFRPARVSLEALRAAHSELVRSGEPSKSIYNGMGFQSSSPSPSP